MNEQSIRSETHIAKQVAAAILERQGHFFLARRRMGMKNGGLWEFPGGKVDPGETPQEGLQREMREEFGIQVAVGELVAENEFQYPHGRIQLLAYRVFWDGHQLELTDHDQIAWAAPDQLLTFPLTPADIPIARLLADHG